RCARDRRRDDRGRRDHVPPAPAAGGADAPARRLRGAPDDRRRPPERRLPRPPPRRGGAPRAIALGLQNAAFLDDLPEAAVRISASDATPLTRRVVARALARLRQ